jgi:hypothetical protein
MEKPELRGKVQVHRYCGRAACDVAVTFLYAAKQNYRQAVEWAKIEAESYRITVELPKRMR